MNDGVRKVDVHLLKVIDYLPDSDVCLGKVVIGRESIVKPPPDPERLAQKWRMTRERSKRALGTVAYLSSSER